MVEPASQEQDPFQLIIAGLSERLAKPSESLPSVRCLSKSALVGIINETARTLRIPASRIPSGVQAVNRLLKARLIQSMPFDDVSPRIGKNRLFAVGLGTDVGSIHPLELLQAQVPAGIVCYMTALEVHGLTTQPTTHHHIARLETAPTRLLARPEQIAARSRPDVAEGTRVHATKSLGQWQFTYQGLRYYLTFREPQLLRVSQVRYLNDKSWFRVTTLEQALLDTLHRPVHCGGPAVVFEAWSAALEKIDSSKMLGLLDQIGDPWLSRRAGYMLERIGIECGAATAPDDDAAISLLSGIPYSTLDTRWNVFVP